MFSECKRKQQAHEFEVHVVDDLDPQKGDDSDNNNNHADFYNNDKLRNPEGVQLSDPYEKIKPDSRAGAAKRSIEKAKDVLKAKDRIKK